MILLYLIFWFTNLALLRDCVLDIDTDFDKNCVVYDLCLKECDFSTFLGFLTWNFSSAAGRLIVEETMPLNVNEEVLKQDLKVM